MIERDYPSYDAWLADFKASGLAARGWVWLAYDHDLNMLTTVVGDAQNTFPLWNATPILALDVYEHAYWIDYGRARAKYIDAFFNNLDWGVVRAEPRARARHAGGRTSRRHDSPGAARPHGGRAPDGSPAVLPGGSMATATLLPVIGKPAPDFTLPSTTGETISLRQYKGKKTVVLYFYPKDETPGCTREACDFRDHVAGVRAPRRRWCSASRPTTSSRTSSSPTSTSCRSRCCPTRTRRCRKMYGVYKQKNLYGKKFMGIERTTFVIDRTGRIAQIYPKVKVDGHVAGVLEFVGED